ncbi:VTT domain-containing protein [Pedobacter caeni]|uniref:Uncharacterized membrane protein YdjX, TVP38/TMEM64 family, SNARE-associated domain n=1 Tax=Pedobacter caeni TaxID=288992 RepID=A0A1M4UD57_9SPHI|nr:VTT domain-containing protein [Pedobacter caeni]SHE54665.1 Uncharacterized membrane protein YdjX, TVP38/TMEM64 family, SNARE-associated domain [Pedobacter caeni]
MAKEIIKLVWAAFLFMLLVLYFKYHAVITPAQIAAFLQRNTNALILCYSLISVLRGLTLIPSTPFLLAGLILFPGARLLVFIITITSLFMSSSLIFFCSALLGFTDYFEKLHPDKINRIRTRLSRPSGSYFIFFWSFLPVTPTDLVCYVAGSLKIKYIHFIIPLMIGEIIICAIYSFINFTAYLSQLF